MLEFDSFSQYIGASGSPPAWVVNAQYVKNQFVTNGNNVYMALEDHLARFDFAVEYSLGRWIYVRKTDAYFLNRANHTGFQDISTITGLQDVLDYSNLIGTTAERLAYIPLDVGQLWYDTDYQNKFYWNGTVWNIIDGDNYREETAAYAITVADHTVNCTANTFTVTLPTAIGFVSKKYRIINSGAGLITVDTTGGQTISGNPSVNLTTWQSIDVMSDGANYLII